MYTVTDAEIEQFIADGCPVLCFWKAEAAHGVFCNWAVTPFTVNGVLYRTSEHYMMAEKAALMGDAVTRHKILTTDSPKDAKSLGQRVKPWNEELWISERCRIVYEACMAKFTSTPELRAALMATGNSIIVEASPLDNIWGVGVGAAKGHDPREWRGLNLLGKVLMKVRSDLAAANG